MGSTLVQGIGPLKLTVTQWLLGVKLVTLAADLGVSHKNRQYNGAQMGRLRWKARGVLVATQRYVIDDKGRKTAVVLNMKEFKKIRQRLEDLEDALELKKAVAEEHEFRDLGEIRREERPDRRSSRKS